DHVLQDGIHESAQVDGLATRSEREISVLIWNYHDDDVKAPAAPVRLAVTGVPASHVLVEHFRIDDSHSNSYTAWQKMGSPQKPTPEQYAALEAAGQLQLFSSPEWKATSKQQLDLEFDLPRLALSLVRISW